jgi:hypothetical protein
VLHEKTRNKQKAHRLSDTPKQKGFRRLPTLQSPKTGGHIITQERGVKTAVIKHMGPLGRLFSKEVCTFTHTRFNPRFLAWVHRPVNFVRSLSVPWDEATSKTSRREQPQPSREPPQRGFMLRAC